MLRPHLLLLATLSLGAVAVVLSSSCGSSKGDQAIAGYQDRVANAGHYRIVNLSGIPVGGTYGGAIFFTLQQTDGTSLIKYRANKDLPIELDGGPKYQHKFVDKLPERTTRTYYVLMEKDQLKVAPIDGDPMEPDNGPIIRPVNLSGGSVSFKATVDGKETDLGTVEAGKGSSSNPSIKSGKLVVTVTSGSSTASSSPVDVTDDNAFSAVAFNDAAGKLQVGVVNNHKKVIPVGQGSTAVGG